MDIEPTKPRLLYFPDAQPPAYEYSKFVYLLNVDGPSPYNPISETSVRERILQELNQAGIAVSTAPLRLDPLSGNPNRHDFLSRAHFRVISGDKILCILTVGRSLAAVWTRTTGLTNACPAITCRPLFFFHAGEWDYFAIEYFNGRDLESLSKTQSITPHDILVYKDQVTAELDRSLKPSSLTAATIEIDTFFEKICSLPLFSGFDQLFLKHAIFPFIKSGALSGPLNTRWTNGDFIARNILVNERKECRLIDYEFAANTHFYAEDAWRWRTLSSFPANIQASDVTIEGEKPWVEAYCLLRQLALAHEINGAQMAIPDSQPALIRLRELASSMHDRFRTSTFLQPIGIASETNSRLNQAQSQLAQAQSRLAQAQSQLAQTQSQLAQTLNKVTRIQNTTTWRTAEWITSLRKNLLFSKPPKFHFHLDTPRAWRPYGSVINMSGWCFAKSNLQLNDVRVKIDGRTFNGKYGQARADVALVYPQNLHAHHSGFQIEIELQPNDRCLELYVCDDDECWHVAYRADLTKSPTSAKGSYEHWIKEYDTLTPEKLGTIKTHVATLPRQPLISIILPVYNTPESYLTKAIESVRSQIYQQWELCVADDASTARHVRPLLERFAREDSRIKLYFRETNGHIAAASNSALALATGEYIALLDHDDELRPHALAEVVKAINTTPDLQLIYSDEDKLDGEGNRFGPYFKPDWMPDLFIGHNYLCHFCVCRTDNLRKIGGWRSGFDGAQDWDLQLRIIEQAKPEQIIHIPTILYHWRAIAGSTALATGEKNYVVEAARRAITEHFTRTNQRVELIHLPGNHWRAKYALPTVAPLVSLIIPTRNGLKHLRCCIDSILEKTRYPAYEILIIDNGSDDPSTRQYLEQIVEPRSRSKACSPNCSIRVLSSAQPFNYSALNNFGVQEARGQFIGLLNNDLEIITPEWLDEMVSHAARPEIGCVGAMLYYPNNTLQHAGVVLGIAGHAGHAFKGFARNSPGYMNHARLVKNYTAVTGACLVLRKATYEQVGGLDAKDLAISLNDVDLCLKVHSAGYRNLWTPFAELYHHESATRGYEDTPEKQARFAKEREILRTRWLAILNRDPAYNPNLTLETEDFAFAYPPRK